MFTPAPTMAPTDAPTSIPTASPTAIEVLDLVSTLIVMNEDPMSEFYGQLDTVITALTTAMMDGNLSDPKGSFTVSLLSLILLILLSLCFSYNFMQLWSRSWFSCIFFSRASVTDEAAQFVVLLVLLQIALRRLPAKCFSTLYVSIFFSCVQWTFRCSFQPTRLS